MCCDQSNKDTLILKCHKMLYPVCKQMSELEERILRAESLLHEKCAEISVLHTRTETLLKRVEELEARSSPQEVALLCFQ